MGTLFERKPAPLSEQAKKWNGIEPYIRASAFTPMVIAPIGALVSGSVMTNEI
jgi:hypothetical protein